MIEKFWWILTGAVIAWYSTVTIYVGIRGAMDIKAMLKRLQAQCEDQPDECA